MEFYQIDSNFFSLHANQGETEIESMTGVVLQTNVLNKAKASLTPSANLDRIICFTKQTNFSLSYTQTKGETEISLKINFLNIYSKVFLSCT